MTEKIYFVVKEFKPGGELPPKVVDITIMLNDVSSPEESLKAANLEYDILREQWPAGEYGIDEIRSDVFPEPQYLKERKLSEIREVSASEVLKGRTEPAQR